MPPPLLTGRLVAQRRLQRQGAELRRAARVSGSLAGVGARPLRKYGQRLVVQLLGLLQGRQQLARRSRIVAVALQLRHAPALSTKVLFAARCVAPDLVQ